MHSPLSYDEYGVGLFAPMALRTYASTSPQVNSPAYFRPSREEAGRLHALVERTDEARRWSEVRRRRRGDDLSESLFARTAQSLPMSSNRLLKRSSAEPITLRLTLIIRTSAESRGRQRRQRIGGRERVKFNKSGRTYAKIIQRRCVGFRDARCFAWYLPVAAAALPRLCRCGRGGRATRVRVAYARSSDLVVSCNRC